MRILLLKYNKVTTEAFEIFARHSGMSVTWGDLTTFRRKMDVLGASELSPYLESLRPFDAVMVGDIFWPTGQTICRWAAKSGCQSFFLQHGQWIYTANKRSPDHLPTATFVYGTKLRNEIKRWPYGRRSEVFATGNPRYDELVIENGDSVYFSPPVVLELNPSAKPIKHDRAGPIRKLEGLDRQVKLLIQPHYREGNVRFLHKLFPNAEFIDPAAPALPLVARSKCVLTHRDSTMVLDGIACRKRVVLMSCRSHYPKGHFSPFAVETNELSGVVSAIENSSTEIDDYDSKAAPFVVLGGASRRIAQLIEERVNVSS